MHATTVDQPVPTTSVKTSLRGLLQAALRQFPVFSARRRQRIALAELDDRLLADIGRGRDEARREAGKPFWRQ